MPRRMVVTATGDSLITTRMPTDDFEGLGMDSPKGFGTDRKYWETVLPLCTFEDRTLTAIELHPVTLAFGTPLPDRGIPRLAGPDRGAEILATFGRLSEPFGTTIEVRDGVGHVVLRDA